MTMRVIDLETTGVDPTKDRILEIASLDIKKTPSGYRCANVMSALVDPERPIPPEASAVHHIIDADVAGKPKIEEAIKPFLATEDDKLVFIAHNANFERGFLWPFIEEAGIEATFLCTYKIALRLVPEAPSHSNQFLRYLFGFLEPFEQSRATIEAHRALSDCYVTAAILCKFLGATSYGNLVEWSTQPALHTMLNFGKHKGMRYEQAPDDYLEWIRDKSDMDDDVKFSARHWLQMRSMAA